MNSRYVRVRSLLTVEPAVEDKGEGSLNAPADALIVDLAGRSDTMASVRARKRASVAAFVTRMRGRAYRPLLLIRLSLLDAQSAADDLEAAMTSQPDGIILADCAGAAAVQQLGARMGVLEATSGLADGSTAIIAEVGATAVGLMALQGLRDASPRLVALSWDAEALAADVGGAPAAFVEDEAARCVARTLLVLGARAAELLAFDTSVGMQGEQLGRDCAAARRIGFSGKMARDVAQVAVINGIFAQPGPQPRAQPV